MTEPEEQPVIPVDIVVDQAHYQDIRDRLEKAERRQAALFATLVIKDRTIKALQQARQHVTTVSEKICLAVLTDQLDAARGLAKAIMRALKPLSPPTPTTSDPSDSSSPTPPTHTSPVPPEPVDPSPLTN